MKRFVTYIFCLLLLVQARPADAAVKTFIRDFTYQAAEMDSKVSCRMIALEQAKKYFAVLLWCQATVIRY